MNPETLPYFRIFSTFSSFLYHIFVGIFPLRSEHDLGKMQLHQAHPLQEFCEVVSDFLLHPPVDKDREILQLKIVDLTLSLWQRPPTQTDHPLDWQTSTRQY